MPRQNARVKSVHFNVTVEDDLKMLNAIGKRNFSRYVKQLIKADLERKKELPQQSIKQSGGIKFVLE
jgi:post-segregation antitoxin (ccd killing protein)